MRIKAKIEAAGWIEPFWFMTDKDGIQYTQMVSIYKSTSPESSEAVIYGLILGPLHFAIGIGD